MLRYFTNIGEAISALGRQFRDNGTEVPHSRWQGLDLTDRGPEWNHFEMMNAGFVSVMPQTRTLALGAIQPNFPWAEDQFQERVGGEPLNPGNTYQQWPHWRPESEEVLQDGKFTHTYMERFWPRWAEGGHACNSGEYAPEPHRGIRYRYGDLNDVVNQLLEDPLTRQAYLPIFFPEDTGAVHGGRVPCTLGYHFMMRGDQLHLWYDIRSCDYLRHFRDDVYMAVRLAQWMLERLARETMHRISSSPELNHFDWASGVSLGNLTFLAHSMHVFMGDRYAL